MHLVGYSKGTRGYIFYSPQDQKTFIRTNAQFLEEDYIRDMKPRSRLVLEELLGERIAPTPSENIFETTIEKPKSDSDVRRSGRIVRQPERYMSYGETMVAVFELEIDEPDSYAEAINGPEGNLGREAMNSKIHSMYSNKVWELVDFLEGVKPIGCKLIYKKKRGPYGNVERFKAGLVAKSYNQKENIDYEETFSPVAMLKSIRILLSITTALDYEIGQMDVKTTFLNGILEERIYMA